MVSEKPKMTAGEISMIIGKRDSQAIRDNMEKGEIKIEMDANCG